MISAKCVVNIDYRYRTASYKGNPVLKGFMVLMINRP